MRSLCVVVLAVALLGCNEKEPSSVFSVHSARVAGSGPRIGYDRDGRPAAMALSNVVVTGDADALSFGTRHSN